MRVSTQGAYFQGLSAMLRLQSELDFTQRQISSGRRILTPSDDPIASARSIELRESLSRTTQFDRNADIAQNRLNYEESALTSVNDVLQRVRELALQGNNATQTNETRSLIAVEMRQHLDNLIQTANREDGNGRYLFSGNLDKSQPVVRAGSVFSYNGDQGQRLIQIGEGRTIADGDSGDAVFFRIRTGNGTFTSSPAAANSGTGVTGPGSLVDPLQYDQDTYTVRFIDANNYEVLDSAAAVVLNSAFQPGDNVSFRGIQFKIDGQPAAADEFVIAPSGFQDIFSTIDNLAAALEQPVVNDSGRADMNNSINSELLNIDQAIGTVLDVRTQVGSRLSAIENQRDTNSAFALTTQETLADIQDLDYAEAISRLSNQASTLEAAQSSFVRTQRLSLFNFL